MNFKAFLNTVGNTARTLPVVILYVTEGCNLKCITCSYRDAMPGELTLEEIEELALQLKKLGLKHIVYSGGEPLLRRDFVQICEVFARHHVKQSLLTNGLLMEKRIKDIYSYFQEIIVSLDGASAETHNLIRGVNSFDLILKGIKTALSLKKEKYLSIRCVIQKNNFTEVPALVDLAKSLGAKRVSFLTADVLSDAFGRNSNGGTVNNESILLNGAGSKEFREIINSMITNYKNEFANGFISESPAKMTRLADYFDAHLGKNDFPVNTCNAPMVSAVITSTGEIQPCYFLPSYGNIRKRKVNEMLNSDSIKATRSKVKNFEIERCKTCVCTLNVNSKSALFGAF